eukprot:GEMP01061486.1.p1 GENE.GEMP01061486.1~~GEMP01061486.1.p1  ORF type:complete len:101 (-),score=4.82 GEMP01061486.1:205-507(-)
MANNIEKFKIVFLGDNTLGFRGSWKSGPKFSSYDTQIYFVFLLIIFADIWPDTSSLLSHMAPYYIHSRVQTWMRKLIIKKRIKQKKQDVVYEVEEKHMHY